MRNQSDVLGIYSNIGLFVFGEIFFRVLEFHRRTEDET